MAKISSSVASEIAGLSHLEAEASKDNAALRIQLDALEESAGVAQVGMVGQVTDSSRPASHQNAANI